jgi:hypothetical protein
MKILGIKTDSKRLFISVIFLMITTIISFSIRLFLKGYLPHGLNMYGHRFIPIVLLFFCITFTVLLISILKISGFKKIVILPFLVLILIIIVPSLGFELEKPFAKAYYNINAQRFNDLIRILNQDSISSIILYQDYSINIRNNSNNLIKNQRLDKIIKHLNIKHISYEKDILIFYDYSSFDGFGYVVKNDSATPIQSLIRTKKKIKELKITKDIYFFRF